MELGGDGVGGAVDVEFDEAGGIGGGGYAEGVAYMVYAFVVVVAVEHKVEVLYLFNYVFCLVPTDVEESDNEISFFFDCLYALCGTLDRVGKRHPNKLGR